MDFTQIGSKCHHTGLTTAITSKSCVENRAQLLDVERCRSVG